MALAGSFVDDSAMPTNLRGLYVVKLLSRHELHAAVAVPTVVPVDKRHHPLAGLVLAHERPAGIVRPILGRPIQLFGVGVSLDTLGLEKELSMLSSSSRLSNVAVRIALPLSGWSSAGACGRG